jgi:hypothetical protein
MQTNMNFCIYLQSLNYLKHLTASKSAEFDERLGTLTLGLFDSFMHMDAKYSAVSSMANIQK